MRIDGIKHQQNFGMALKIEKGAAKFLEKQSEVTLKNLFNAGNNMKSYKNWDLIVGSEGCKIKAKNGVEVYKAPFTLYNPPYAMPADVSRDLGARCVYDGVETVFERKGLTEFPLRFPSVSENVQAYEILKSGTEIDKAIAVTKGLEHRDEFIATSLSNSENAFMNYKQNLIEKIISTFSKN